MNTKTFFATIFTLSLVIFAATSGITNPANSYTGDNLKKNNNKAASVNKAETVSDNVADELNYLRFDVNEYVTESMVEELPVSTFDYLRFDVNNYVESNASEIMEMPVSYELNYLRFNVNNFVSGNSSELDEMPVNDFDYLRFDVNKYANTTERVIDELPIKE
jgi:hypothetical protein